MTSHHFNLNHWSNLICCHPSRFDESNNFFCSNLLNKFINNNNNHNNNNNYNDFENNVYPNETSQQQSPLQQTEFVQNHHQLNQSPSSTANNNHSAPYYYGDIVYRQPLFNRYSNHFDSNCNSDWNRETSSSIKSSIMDGLRVGIKNQVRQQSNQYLRSPNVNRSDEFKVSLRGWLYRLEGAAIKQWKRRWCVLADYCLFYYKDMAEEKMLGSLLLPSYKISPCFSRNDGISRKFAFKAEHNNMKTYYFSADSKEYQQQWMNALSMASIMQLSAMFSATTNTTTTNNNSNNNNNNVMTGDKQINNDINDDHCNNNKINDNNDRKESILEQRQRLVGTTTGLLSNRIIQDDESGFLAYHQTKRCIDDSNNVIHQLQQQQQQIYPITNYDGQNYLPSLYHHHQQQQSYNGSIGLPIYYPSSNHSSQFINNSEYIADAPPKPQRHYYDLMLPQYHLQDYRQQTYKLYHQHQHHHHHGQQIDPNLINQNYFVPTATAVADEQNFPVPYHTVISSDFNIIPQHQQQQFEHGYFAQNLVDHSQLSIPQQQRLPPRPRSADFLERNQDFELDNDDVDDQECQTLFSINKNNENKTGDVFNNNNNNIVNTESTRIMPTRPKSSIEKYYHQSAKFDPYMARNLFHTTYNNDNDEIIPSTTIPNRPPLPQEYIFRFQQQQQQLFDTVGLPQQQTTTTTTTMMKIKQDKNIVTTYTSDDEIFRKNSNNLPDDNDNDPFELSRKEYQKASKLLFQRQFSSCKRNSNSTKNNMARLSINKKQSNDDNNNNDDWNEIGLPIPSANPNAINDNLKRNELTKIKQHCPVNDSDVQQNQSNEESEIKFKFGLNVRTYRKPTTTTTATITKSLKQQCPSTICDDNDNDDNNVHRSEINVDDANNNDQNHSKQSSISISGNGSSSGGGGGAPYYYSDLLNEEQKIALKKKLGDFAEPPPLLSRCTDSNNTRFLSRTSLTSTTLDKNKTKLSNNNLMMMNDEKKDFNVDEKKHYSSSVLLPNNSKMNCSTTTTKPFDENFPSNKTIHKEIIVTENNFNDNELVVEQLVTNQQQQPIYENCTERTKTPTIQATIPVSHNKRNLSNNLKKQTRKILNNNKKLNKADSLDSLHEIPIETSSLKKRRRKRKSRENLNNNNASDSEIQFDDDDEKVKSLNRFSSRKHFLKSSRRFSVSAAEYMGKSNEELILMLIQLRRKQSQLEKTMEQLRMQMDSEEKMMEIQPYRKDDYQLRFNELNRKWKEINREYQLQLPIIQTIDHMIKMKSKTMLNELNKKKAASTSNLDRVVVDDNDDDDDDNNNNNRFKSSMKNDCDNHHSADSISIQTAAVAAAVDETPNENIEILKRQQKVLEGELDRVRGMLTHSTKKLEEKAVENARMEQEMLLARNKLKQVLENEQEAMEITRSSKLEAELAHINEVIDDLHNRRKELNNAIENLKNSETKFMTDRFNDNDNDDDGDDNNNYYSNYHRFTNEELKLAVNNAAETSLYPLYENIIKKSQTFVDSKQQNDGHEQIDDDDDDDDDDDNCDPINNIDNNLNDEFFTLNINLDKHHQHRNHHLSSNSSSQTINGGKEINNNITTMCEFDPNKVMSTYGGSSGDSIVDQQLKQIYNYHHQQQQQQTQQQAMNNKSNEVKTVREVKRESERRKFNHHHHHHHHQQQRASSSSSSSRTNYDSYLQTNHHYFNHHNNDNGDDMMMMMMLTSDLKSSIDQPMKFTDQDNDPTATSTTSPSNRNFNTPDIVQSTIKLADKT
ncbi:uncharacterized protein LOC113792221 isoform X2 [Dermatophagoides pteronyssinus]|uniref:uncharacterized protein LOC113792221 isoform X2 n=1 Tax=Dermatophagoides pteronyssinus TaxID=6956 RepID=UPI003F666635